MALMESLKILLMKAGRNDNSGAHQEQSLICGELVSEVPSMPWPFAEYASFGVATPAEVSW